MSLRYAIVELAARHKRDEAELLEDWNERAAIREYVGLGEPGVLQRWARGGDRVRPQRRGAA